MTSGLSHVREGGFEPPRPFGHWHLKPARLPFRHSRKEAGTGYPRPTRAPKPGAGLRKHPPATIGGTRGNDRALTHGLKGANQLSGLQRFENRLEQMISGVFARTFRSAVQPVEISSALAREVDNSAQVLSRDRRLAPNDFHVELSDPDHSRLTSLGSALTDELIGLLKEHAAAQGYVFTGPVGITLEVADDLTTGRFRVRSQAMAKVSQAGPEASETQVRRATAYLEVNGERLPLAAPGVVVGRGNDADLRVNDPGVSRRHIEIRVAEDESGPRVSVHDLGSTNGVLVNGKRVENAAISDGAEIRIGNTTITLHQRQV